jgi:threonine synthase
MLLRLACVACGAVVDGGAIARCPSCGGRLELVRDPPRPAARLPTEEGGEGVWRFAPLLPPVDAAQRVSLGEGGTPVVRAGPTGAAAGLTALHFKDESRNPTGTFKDRLLAVATSVALAEGAGGVVCASTGNAGASAAAYGARAGLRVLILVPAGTAPAKVAQAAMLGARVVAVTGTYSDAYACAAEAATALGWLNGTTTFASPYPVEGGRTVAYELFEQIGVPDWIAVPIGAGPLLVGIHRAFGDLAALGLTARVPRLLALQPAGCAPIARAVRERAPVRAWEAPATVAGGLADPLAGYEEEGEVTVRAIAESGGTALALADEAILAAIRELARTEGLFQEPAGAIAYAGVAAARRAGILARDDVVVACLTGTGLKDPYAAGDPAAKLPVVDGVVGVRALLRDAPT